MVGHITFLMIFAVFDPSVNTMDKLQFLLLILSSSLSAVLISVTCLK